MNSQHERIERDSRDGEARIERPSGPELRQFGLILAAAVALVFGLLVPWWRFGGPWAWPWAAGSHWPAWPWLVAAALVVWAFAHPASLWSIYRPWMKLAGVLQWLLTRLIMVFLFYVVVTPIGLVRRLLGRDGLRRELDPNAESYRVIPDERDRNRMDRPY